MKTGRIAVLALLVAALGAYLYFYELPQAEKESKKEKLLAGVGKDAVTGIDLSYPDREISLQKGDKGWRLTKPVDAPADDTTVQSLLTTLVDAEVQKTLDEMPSDLAAFGLDKPSTAVKLTLSAGQAPPIAVGKNTAIGGKTYVRKGDEPKLYLTTTSISFGLNKQVKDLRDKQVLTYQDDDVQRIEIARPAGETTVLARKDKDAWTVSPGDHPADPTEVRSFLSSLRSTRALDFPDDAPTDLAQYGLVAPRVTVTVATGKDGAQTQTLLLGGEKTEGSQKQVFAKRGNAPTVYALGDWAFRTIDKQAGQFRDKTILGFDAARAGKIVVTRKDGTATTLVRSGEKWQIEGGEAKDAASTGITRFIDDVRDLKGAEIAAEPPSDLARFGLDAPEVRVAITDKDGQALGTILAGKNADKRYAMRENGPTVFEVRDYMYTRLDKQPKDFSGAAAGTPPPATPEMPADDEGLEDLGGDEPE